MLNTLNDLFLITIDNELIELLLRQIIIVWRQLTKFQAWLNKLPLAVRTENPQLVRAIENLKLALKLKSGSSELSDGQIRSIAGILDRAAEEIEKC